MEAFGGTKDVAYLFGQRTLFYLHVVIKKVEIVGKKGLNGLQMIQLDSLVSCVIYFWSAVVIAMNMNQETKNGDREPKMTQRHDLSLSLSVVETSTFFSTSSDFPLPHSLAQNGGSAKSKISFRYRNQVRHFTCWELELETFNNSEGNAPQVCWEVMKNFRHGHGGHLHPQLISRRSPALPFINDINKRFRVLRLKIIMCLRHKYRAENGILLSNDCPH